MIDPNFPPVNALQVDLGLPDMTDEELLDSTIMAFEDCDAKMPKHLESSKVGRALALLLGIEVEDSGTVHFVGGNQGWNTTEQEIAVREAHLAEMRNRIASKLSSQGGLF